ncbi:unnamed protein product [Sphagnum compactum]
MQRMIQELMQLAISRLRTQMLQVEKVVEVLKPGPLGIKEHKYSDAELQAARTVAEKARENWSRISKQN